MERGRMQESRRRRIGRGMIAAAIAGIGLAAAPLAGQDEVATAPVALEHWGYDALDRLAAAGLSTEGWAAGHRPQSAGAMLAALRAAAKRAAGRSSPLAGFARSSAERFAGEYPHAGGGRPGATSRRQIVVRAGGLGDAGDREAASVGVDLSASYGRHVALSYGSTMNVSADAAPSVGRPSVTLVGKLGSWWVSAGRQRMAFGPGTDGLVLSGSAAFDGVMFGTDGAVRLGGIGRWLGPLRATAMVSRLPADTLGAAAWFGAMRLTLAPHPRIRIGLNRTTVIGTEVRGSELTLRDVLSIAAGKHTDPNFEDQRASLDLAVLLGNHSWRLAPYVEWGIEDSAGAHLEDPALSAGAYLPYLPGVPALSLRYEYTAFGESARLCWFCSARTTDWYRHGTVRSAYVGENGRLIGHRLGGYGHEHRLEADAWLHAHTARIRAVLIRRHREPRNLLYPNRPGDSHGAGVRASFRVTPALTLDADLRYERGEAGWDERAAWLGARYIF